MSVQPVNNTIIAEKSFVAVLAVLALLVLVIGGLKFAGMSANNAQIETPVGKTLTLRVEDAPQGAVVVRNAVTGAEIQTFKSAEGGFVRAIFRALVHDRRRKGTEIQGDFKLVQHSGGQLYLYDEITGKRLTLDAYGPDNSAVFAAFITNQQGVEQ